jgi:GDPmannose 4,6-dehydratase
MNRRALVTGICGQDAGYLAELLLERDYKVFGMKRKNEKSDYVPKDVDLIDGDMNDNASLFRALKSRPHDVYNLAGQSSVKNSFSLPEFSGNVNGLGVVRLLEECRRIDPMPKFFQAGSSEMFGYAPAPQNEQTPFHPRSPYGCAKVYAYHMVVNYRQAYKMFACNGIMYNHESRRRPSEFVTQKIAEGAVAIKLGRLSKLKLGNLDSQRDWGHAQDYVRAMWLMLQRKRPDDYVIATGITHSVRDFCEIAFSKVGLDYEKHVVIDPALFRPTDVECLVGDASKAKRELGWKPKTGFDELVAEMVDAAMERLS